jgi:hypothetical protein
MMLVTEAELREAARKSPALRMAVEELLAAIRERRKAEQAQHQEAAE